MKKRIIDENTKRATLFPLGGADLHLMRQMGLPALLRERITTLATSPIRVKDSGKLEY
jgi:hypothetical protein